MYASVFPGASCVSLSMAIIIAAPTMSGVVVPPGVAHAIRAEGSEDVIMVYGTSTIFHPSSEGRIASEIETAARCRNRGSNSWRDAVEAQCSEAARRAPLLHDVKTAVRSGRAGIDGSAAAGICRAGARSAKYPPTQSLVRQSPPRSSFCAPLDQAWRSACALSILPLDRAIFRD